jgi:hypothetical protein
VSRREAFYAALIASARAWLSGKTGALLKIARPDSPLCYFPERGNLPATAMAKGKFSGGGKRTGSPNKATAQAREAIALFVDGNAYRLQGWLDQIAEGVRDKPTKEHPDGELLVSPDPKRAFELFQSVIEYHVPKLGRIEHTDPNGKPLPIVQVTFVKK